MKGLTHVSASAARLVAGITVLLAAVASQPGPVAGGSGPPPAGIRIVPVGLAPYALALDTLTQRAFVVNSPQSISVVDTKRGIVLRTLHVDYGAYLAAVAEQSNRAFVVAGTSSAVTILNATTGAPLRTRTFATAIGGLQAVTLDEAAGRLVLAGYDGLLILDTASGAVVHEIDQPLTASSLALAAHAHRLLVTTAAGTATLIVDVRTGALLHTVPLSLPPGRPVDERSDHVVALAVDPQGTASLALLDVLTGRTLRRVPLGPLAHEPQLAVAVDTATNRLFLFSRADKVGVLDLRTLTLMSVRPQCFPRALVLGTPSSRVFGLCWDTIDRYGNPAGAGSVYALDGRSGRLQRRVPVGYAPDGLAVDERAGQVVVLNGGQNGGTLMLIALPLFAPPHPSPGPGSAGARTLRVGPQPSALALDEPAHRLAVLERGGVRILDSASGSHH